MAALPNLRVRGIMGIPAPTSDAGAARAQFRALRRCYEDCRDAGLAVDTLSMGMSADLELAVAEGATEVRIGTAIFGARRDVVTRIHRMNLTFIGGGNMATALIGGLVATGVDTRAFRIVEPARAQQDKLAARFPGIGIFGDVTLGAIQGADLVVIAVKPQHMQQAAQLAGAVRRSDPGRS